ncbi:MAG TPA: hypothetical protein VGX68_27935, partial [Thermoanaerobaculia bacterium]|nr:hypothetical protein [Thermoanaerobaculia bacterium]
MPTPVAKLLEMQFQGYFMCRIATDPDPTNEQRGVSGYTIALLPEDVLDQVIRTQLDPAVPEDREFLEKNLREPAQEMGIKIAVNVNDVLFDGQQWFGPARNALLGARLYLEGTNPPFPGPTFDSRNNIVGSDDNMAFVVNPFELVIKESLIKSGCFVFLNSTVCSLLCPRRLDVRPEDAGFGCGFRGVLQSDS